MPLCDLKGRKQTVATEAAQSVLNVKRALVSPTKSMGPHVA